MSQDADYHMELGMQNIAERLHQTIQERDALSAVVERLREALNDLLSADEQAEGYGVVGVADDIRDKVRDVLALTPATALRLHEAKFLEDLSQRINAGGRNRTIQLRDILCQHAARLRAGGEG